MSKTSSREVAASKHPAGFDKAYWDQLRRCAIRLLISGIDWFPNSATGIPFCKPTWREQLHRGSSSYWIIVGLGLNPFKVAADPRFPTPRDFFLYLLTERGIGFVNASHVFVCGRLTKKTRPYFERAEPLNRSIMARASHVLLCGGPAIAIYQDLDHAVTCLHPAQRRPKFRQEWQDTWGQGGLNTAFDLDF